MKELDEAVERLESAMGAGSDIEYLVAALLLALVRTLKARGSL